MQQRVLASICHTTAEQAGKVNTLWMQTRWGSAETANKNQHRNLLRFPLVLTLQRKKEVTSVWVKSADSVYLGFLGGALVLQILPWQHDEKGDDAQLGSCMEMTEPCCTNQTLPFMGPPAQHWGQGDTCHVPTVTLQREPPVKRLGNTSVLTQQLLL